MITIRQILAGKNGDAVYSIGPDETVYAAIEAMEKKGIGALVVIDSAGTLRGIITERDYTRKIALKDRSSKTTLVKEIMTTNVYTVGPDENLEDCMMVMYENGFRHLPVVDDGGRVCAMLSIKDVLKTLITEKEYIIQQLESYIAGAV